MAFLRASASYQAQRLMSIIVVGLLLLTGGLLTGGFVVTRPPQPPPPSRMLVTTLEDNNEKGSLRWYIGHAPSGRSTIITFAPGLRGTIKLTEGWLVVTSGKQITIKGPRADQLAISGGEFNTINVNQGATLSISDLSVKNSETFDFPILSNQGTLTLDKSFITGNKTISTASFGGGIYNSGNLRVTNSTISNNSSITIYKSSSFGGGIYNSGQLTVTNSTISNNTARVTTQEGSSVGGGGIANSNKGTVTVTNSTFSNNTATSGKQEGVGGGIDNSGQLTVDTSTFSRNTASSSNSSFGGGIDNSRTGKLTVTNSTFLGNESSGKQEGQGGGIDNEGKLAVINSTFWGNTASGGSDAGGGGISFTSDNKDAFTDVRFSTLYGNTSSAGGGIWVDPKYDSGVMRISDNIVAANSARDGANISDIHRKLTSDGYNLSDNFAGASMNPTDRQVKLADLKIDSTLHNNGGPIQTLALLSGSPAIGAVPGKACSSITVTDAVSGQTRTITTDERGISRLNRLKNACDSGAYQSPD